MMVFFRLDKTDDEGNTINATAGALKNMKSMKKMPMTQSWTGKTNAGGGLKPPMLSGWKTRHGMRKCMEGHFRND